MDEARFFLLIKVAVVFLVTLWFIIACNLVYKKYRFAKLRAIEYTFANIVSRHLYGDDTSESISIPEIRKKLRNIGIVETKTKNVQYIIDLMIRTQRSFLGKNHEKIRELYKKIPPYNASFKKLSHKDWHIRARGIREIYEMNQSQYLAKIARFKNDPNIFIRREAQIGLVVFLGWESLRFLPYLSRRLELWQQIKIVEKLHDFYPEPKLEYLKDAYNIEHDYGRELVMRIIRKYMLVEEVDYIIYHLYYDSFEVRETAIYCLFSFSLNEDQLEKVKLSFSLIKELQQQKQILKLIQKSETKFDLSFYINLLQVSPPMVKLHVAEILWNKGYKEEVYQYYLDQYKTEAPKQLKMKNEQLKKKLDATLPL